MNLHDGVLSIRLAFWDELSVGVTFLSGKVTKTIAICKTRSITIFSDFVLPRTVADGFSAYPI